MPRRFRTVTTAAILLVPIFAGGFLLQKPTVRADDRLLSQVMSLVANNYVDSLGPSNVYEKAAHGLVRELNDPYSELLAPKQNEDFNRATGGRYGGTGMLLEDQPKAAVVARVFPHTPAEEAGVREGDRIVEIDGKSTAGWDLTKVSETLRGTPGSQVAVTFARPGVNEPIKLHFTRAIVHVPAVSFVTMLDDHIGYIPLQTFNENAAEEVESAVRDLEGKGAKGIVLDMRDNGGGIVDQALAISSLFLDEGKEIVSVRTRSAPTEVSYSRGRHLGLKIPLAVLVDAGSASATEIVAGALQDHDRALLLGTRTFGKGLVQSLFPLDGGYALKMTTGKWYTPSGRSIHRERKLLADGRFVTTSKLSDTTDADTSLASRPVFKSDAGRVIYGGGGITPDVIVKEDTASTTEQEFFRAIAPKAQAVQTVLSQYTVDLKSQVTSPDFRMSPAWSDELMRRLAGAGVTIDPKYAAAARTLLGRELERRLARQAFGDAAAKKRDLGEDRPLTRAIDLLRRADSQDALFRAAKGR